MDWQGKKKLPLNRMALILAIETATEVCSVSMAYDGIILGELHLSEGNMHASKLHVLIDNLLKETGKTLNQIEAIAVSMGPGSYTGLRVGVAAAKGFCLALNIPLIAVNTLQSLSATALVQTEIPEKALLAPMLDARRMEVYTALLQKDLSFTQNTNALILDESSLRDSLIKQPIYYFGNGANKAQDLLQHPNAHFIPNVHASAAGMAQLAEAKFKSKQFEDIAYFEPFYLKDFVGTTPKKRT
jgi:tRNA threonylcarbamoyladenosine biosynthesis protein TsaB